MWLGFSAIYAVGVALGFSFLPLATFLLAVYLFFVWTRHDIRNALKSFRPFCANFKARGDGSLSAAEEVITRQASL